MMTKPSAVATAVGNPHTGMPAFDAAGLLGRLAALVEDLPGEVAAGLPAGSIGLDGERVAARGGRGACAICRRPAGTITWRRASFGTLSPVVNVTYARKARRQDGWRRARGAVAHTPTYGLLGGSRVRKTSNCKGLRKKARSPSRWAPGSALGPRVAGFHGVSKRVQVALGSPPLGNRAGFHGISKRDEMGGGVLWCVHIRRSHPRPWWGRRCLPATPR